MTTLSLYCLLSTLAAVLLYAALRVAAREAR